MKQGGDFYVILPSNANTNLFPTNSASYYRDALPRQIHLPDEEDWEVGLHHVIIHSLGSKSLTNATTPISCCDDSEVSTLKSSPYCWTVSNSIRCGRRIVSMHEQSPHTLALEHSY